MVLATTLLFGVASVGCALADNLTTLLIFRGLQGLCGGAGLVVGRAIIRDRFDGAEAQRMMSQVTMLFSLSPAIARRLLTAGHGRVCKLPRAPHHKSCAMRFIWRRGPGAASKRRG